MATIDNPSPLLTIDQLADRLGTTVRHVGRLVAERRIPYLKVGKFVRFDPVDIQGRSMRCAVLSPAVQTAGQHEATSVHDTSIPISVCFCYGDRCG